jgi:hypothetical protein
MLPLLLSLSRPWSGQPHWIIARIAQRVMPNATSAWVDAQLTAWPGEEGTLVTLASWHDAIRTAVTAPWHFVDTPLYAPSYAGGPARPVFNVTSLLSDHFGAARVPGLSAWSRSFFVRGFSHFVGDLHCPVHATERFTAADPDGDLGANTVEVTSAATGRTSKLHAYWDTALGQYTTSPPLTDRTIDQRAAALMDEWPASGFAAELAETDFLEWALGVYRIGVDFVYAGLVETENATVVTDAYVDAGRVQARRMMALAGYRLAQVLQAFWEAQTAAPPPAAPSATDAAGVGAAVGAAPASGAKARRAVAWVVDALLFVVVCVYGVLNARKSKEIKEERRAFVGPLAV